MSEVSMLSTQFRALGKTVDQINHAIIVLKAQMVNNEHNNENKVIIELEEGELEHAISYIKSFVERLVSREQPGNQNAQLLQNPAVQQLIADTPDFFDQLRTVQVSIDKLQNLTLVQIGLLDQIIEAFDQERSELFKNLRAARG